MYRQFRYPFILSCDAERLGFDLSSDLLEIRETTVDMEELSVFGVRVVRGGWRVYELEHERSSGDDALTSW